MLSPTDRLVATETLLLGGSLVVVYHLDTTALWIVWALVTVAVAGVTLLSLNWLGDADRPIEATDGRRERDSAESSSQEGESVIDSVQSTDAGSRAGNLDEG